MKSFAASVREELRAKSPRATGDPDARLLRQAFLDAGSMSDPEKGYHLEFVCPDEDTALELLSAASHHDITGKVTSRTGHAIVYFKDGEDIVRLLGLMGAPLSLMEFENKRIMKEMRGSINRKVNCETANIEKTVTAAAKQLEDIRFLETQGALERMEETLQEMARVRLSFPDATLKELGTHLSPPTGKSGVNHRLRRLTEAANRLREERAASS